MGNLNGLELLLVRELDAGMFSLLSILRHQVDTKSESGYGVILRRGEIKCIALGRMIVAGCFKDEKGEMR
jgi:hypothetical protein